MAKLEHPTAAWALQGPWATVAFPHPCHHLARPCVHPQAGGGPCHAGRHGHPSPRGCCSPSGLCVGRRWALPAAPGKHRACGQPMPKGFLVPLYLSGRAGSRAPGQAVRYRPCPSVPAPRCPCLPPAHCCLLLAHPWPSLPIVVSSLPPVPAPSHPHLLALAITASSLLIFAHPCLLPPHGCLFLAHPCLLLARCCPARPCLLPTR